MTEKSVKIIEKFGKITEVSKDDKKDCKNNRKDLKKTEACVKWLKKFK